MSECVCVCVCVCVAGVSKVYVAGTKLAAPKRLLVLHSPVWLASLARKVHSEQVRHDYSRAF